MNVDRFIPPADHPLRPYLHSMWRVGARSDYTCETILPKGNVDIFFNLGDSFSMDSGNPFATATITRGAWVAGLQTATFCSHPDDEVLLFGVSLKAEAAGTIFRLPASEVTNIALEATVLFENIDDITEQLHDEADFTAQCRLLGNWLLRFLRPDPHAEMIHHACRTISRNPTDLCLDTIARDLNFSTRHLRRLFQQHVGIGPSHYLRLSRFINAIGLMTTSATLTEIAHESHYHDQAHFCRDFKEFGGMTPGEYRERAGHVPGHLFV